MDGNVTQWRKASRSNDTGGSCVEVATLPQGVGVRDSKDPDGPRLLLSRDAFRTLTANLKR
ncbi:MULTISPECIES: DUF397 domain-containing protein [Actinomadura]|uniref:DUF397 domain-containing protein n=1 Tax=Actinomadura yumaensis TaxID=111807 RepID=A0ABW2CC35_9ACTN|nr:DUF397 domain-containing protein [Actinomadura sp. J1-007]MWK33718.1 DUF397 domain-containing protein [Actinomadura sp. J1-007]